MEEVEKKIITVSACLAIPARDAWKIFTSPEDIVNWNHASNDWHTVKALNDLQVGGRFSYRMEAKDGSVGFDLSGKYTKVVGYACLCYTLDDSRTVEVEFKSKGDRTEIVQSFEPESVNDPELQRQGWQAILDNFKSYAERAYQESQF